MNVEYGPFGSMKRSSPDFHFISSHHHERKSYYSRHKQQSTSNYATKYKGHEKFQFIEKDHRSAPEYKFKKQDPKNRLHTYRKKGLMQDYQHFQDTGKNSRNHLRNTEHDRRIEKVDMLRQKNNLSKKPSCKNNSQQEYLTGCRSCTQHNKRSDMSLDQEKVSRYTDTHSRYKEHQQPRANLNTIHELAQNNERIIEKEDTEYHDMGENQPLQLLQDNYECRKTQDLSRYSRTVSQGNIARKFPDGLDNIFRTGGEPWKLENRNLKKQTTYKKRNQTNTL